MSTDKMRKIAEKAMSCGIEWEDDVTGYLDCPGLDSHNTPDAPKDCRIKLDGVPTLSCFHSSCKEQVDSANRQLRSLWRKHHLAVGIKPSSSAILKRNAAKRRISPRNLKIESSLVIQTKVALPKIVNDFATPPAKWLTMSPEKISENPADHWHQILRLYRAHDVIWIGPEVWASSSTNSSFAANFRTVDAWLSAKYCPGKFTCPAIFKEGVHSRSDANIACRPYLVVESDVLTKAEVGAVFSWMRQFMILRAIVDTAGKSLHGWFDFPDQETESELRIILPALGCDAALFKKSQPCRLPGAMRDGKFQKLLFLHPEGVVL